MSKFRILLERIEEQAVEVEDLKRAQASAFETARKDHNLLKETTTNQRAKTDELRAEISRLRSRRDPEARQEEAYDELHRVVIDAYSLIRRTDLSDAEKVKSIEGLLDQVRKRDWFASSPYGSSSRKPTRQTKATAMSGGRAADPPVSGSPHPCSKGSATR